MTIQSPAEEPGCTSTTPFFLRGGGEMVIKKKKFSLRNKDGKHSLEGFVSSWWISGGAFLGGVISETAFWALMLVLYFLSCNRRINTQK